ncbi:FIMAH domain-containing protein [Falsibacillus pallidus]|uniref:Outer membrane protein assembly factor BamB n=1 Tax=Falsibacillus pallidus TaxID=493781 RepID=A0A370G8A0_9BACI|nr:hypothetical protein [Falsibacillus pallidus]RDI40011.1 outer membrane protein assembly factor BamB [Falsibacillus pallidus]
MIQKNLKKCFRISATGILIVSLASMNSPYSIKAKEKPAQNDYFIENAGFESTPKENGAILGWTQTYGDTGFSIDRSVVKEGTQSLKMADSLSTKSAGIRSSMARVTGGQVYHFDASIYLQSGSLNMYLLYFDENGKEVAKFSSGYSVKSVAANTWLSGSVSGKAPKNAVSARLELYSGVASVTNAFVDQVSFSWEEQLDLTVSDPVNLGEAVKASLTSSAAISTRSDGHSELYFATNGVPATFYAIDGDTGERLFSQPIPGADTVWAITEGSDGNIYFAGTNDGILYRYLPAEKRIETLGKNPSDTWIWDLAVSKDGKVYGATYPHAKVFEYDIQTGEFKDLGTFKDGQKYARGLGISGDYLYVGIGSTAYVYRLNLKTGEKEEVHIPISGGNNTVANIEGYDGKLFIRVGGSTVYVLDEETLELVNTIKYTGEISPPSPDNGEDMYYILGAKLHRYNLKTNTTEEVSGISSTDHTTRKFGWVEKDGHSVLALVSGFSEYMQYDPMKNEVEYIYPDVEPQGVPIQSLAKAPDGKIYLGGYHRGMSVFDPRESKIIHNLSWMPQPEGIGFFDGKVFFGTYGGAKIYQYDPAKAMDFGNTPDKNPGLIHDIEDFQDRPFTLESSGNDLFIGTIPGYGELGGSLSIYHKQTGQWEDHRNVVENQSIIGLAYKDGYVYGGTSVWGGGGSNPADENAKIFVWDVKNSKKVAEFTPDIPGLDADPKMIGELSAGPDGLIWGAIDGTIFAMDPKTYEVKKSKVVYPSTYAASKWRPIYLRWGKDGLLYTTLGRNITVVNPGTLSTMLIKQNADLMDIENDGSLYYASGADLMKLEVHPGETSFNSVREEAEEYRSRNMLDQPLYKQLLEDLKQADHQLEKGNGPNAIEFLEKAKEQINKDSLSKFISLDAKNVLTASLDSLIRQPK